MERQKGITLTNGQTAEEYVKSFPAEPKERRETIIESILEVSRKGWPLNDLVIMSEARERNRKKLGIK